MRFITRAGAPVKQSALMAAMLAACCCNTQAINLLIGPIKNVDDNETSGVCQVEYRADFRQHCALSLAYLNEGHFRAHHRDGLAGQFWLEGVIGRLTLAAGAGPYLYCNTKNADDAADYYNNHGVGLISSLGLQWPLTERISLLARGNWIVTGDMDTFAALMGVGGLFDAPGKAPGAPVSAAPAARPGNEITLLAGKTIVNSFGSETTVPISVEYRRRIRPHLEWTLAGLDEGCNSMINRHGAATQLWLTDNLGGWPLTFGLGVGAYLAFDRKGEEREMLAGLVSLTAGYQFLESWVARVNWHRVMANYDRDTDVILAGMGYLF